MGRLATQKPTRTALLPVAALIAIVVLYALVRLVGIDRLVTTDEPFWLGRSANFYRALAEGDFVNTYQMAHPGVMTMWAGAIAYWITFPEYAQLATGNLDNVYSIETVLRGMGQNPLEMMLAAKVSKIIFQSIFFGIALSYLLKLAGITITVITGLLVVFAPFMSGFDSALHVDGLFTTICLAAILAICWAAFEDTGRSGFWQRSWPWLAAGMLAGMALLTRATGMVLVGVVGLALLIQLSVAIGDGHRWWTSLRTAIWRGLLWLLALVATAYALLPALWVSPGPTVRKLWAWSSNAATEGHENPTFYRGIHEGNPGYAVYPEVLAWRMSPVEWLGILLLIVLGTWAWRKRITLTPTLAKTLLVLFVFLVVYVAAMSLGAKKFDRYILPVFPVVALFTGIGITLAMDWIRQRSDPRATLVATSLAGLLIIGQAVSWAGSLPYRLDYYNPVLGGAERAQHILQMGWGQGGDQVIAFLEDQTGDGPITVQTSAVSSAFTYFLPDGSPVQFMGFGLGTPAAWYETDYYVAGIQQTQRGLAPAYHTLREEEPAHTVYVNDVAYFVIFNVRNLPLPDHLRQPTACNFTFGDEITLMQIIGRDETIDLYFLSESEISEHPINLQLYIALPNGETFREEVLVEPAASGMMFRATIANPAAAAAMPLAEAEITMSATSDSGSLSVTAPWLAEPATDAGTQSECYYTSPPGL